MVSFTSPDRPQCVGHNGGDNPSVEGPLFCWREIGRKVGGGEGWNGPAACVAVLFCVKVREGAEGHMDMLRTERHTQNGRGLLWRRWTICVICLFVTYLHVKLIILLTSTLLLLGSFVII